MHAWPFDHRAIYAKKTVCILRLWGVFKNKMKPEWDFSDEPSAKKRLLRFYTVENDKKKWGSLLIGLDLIQTG